MPIPNISNSLDLQRLTITVFAKACQAMQTVAGNSDRKVYFRKSHAMLAAAAPYFFALCAK
jgi:phage major head subunit gpT-like protein